MGSTFTGFTITQEWIEAFATSGRGWTRQQLEAIGVRWPPVHGWRARLEGKIITDAARLEFETSGRPVRAELVSAAVRRALEE